MITFFAIAFELFNVCTHCGVLAANSALAITPWEGQVSDFPSGNVFSAVAMFAAWAGTCQLLSLPIIIPVSFLIPLCYIYINGSVF